MPTSCGVVAIVFGNFAGAAGFIRRHRQRFIRQDRTSTIQLRATSTVEKQEAMKRREEMVQAAIEQSTPVPQSFEQAVTWACTAALGAAEAGRMRQTMYYDAGGGDKEISGDLGGVLPFVEVFAKTLASAEALEGGTVRVLFTDLGAAAMSTSRWEPLPPGLQIDYFPPVMRGQEEVTGEERNKLSRLLESQFLVAVVPTQAELPAILQLMKIMSQLGRDVPVVFFNPKLVQNAYVAAGTLLRSARELERTLVPTFHLEQYDPPDDGEESLNSAVVSRVWPRPFSVWEDNPEDPEAIDGFFLLDLNEKEAPSVDTIRSALRASKDAAKRMAERKKLS